MEVIQHKGCNSNQAKALIKAKKAGTVTITATAKDGSGKKAACKITVKNQVKPAPTPVTVKSVKAIGMMQVQVELTGAKELSSSVLKSIKESTPLAVIRRNVILIRLRPPIR